MRLWSKWGSGMLLLVGTVLLSGCQGNDDYEVKDYELAPSSAQSYEIDEEKEASHFVKKAITDQKVMTLTFDGMGTKETLIPLLEQLERYQIQATFFVTGIEVAEESELAMKIIEAGHQLGNATLSRTDLTELTKEEQIKQVMRSHEEIEEITGVAPTYLRVGKGAVTEELLDVIGDCGYEYVIDYHLSPREWDGKTVEQAANYIFEHKQRGSIVTLNANLSLKLDELIPLVVEQLATKGFSFVSLQSIVELYEARQQNQFVLNENWYDIEGEVNMPIILEGDSSKPQIALTFDDWASDDTIDSILDTLDEYNVKATFFLRAKGVEANPSLAYTIAKRGHEVASHTYSHIDLDTLTEQEIKDEIIKAHKTIAYAINEEPKRYLRPPRGIMNEEIAKAIAECNYDAVMMYGPSALDWDITNTAQDITDYMLENTTNGAILLLHILDGIATPDALPMILEGLLEQGFEFVTLTELVQDQLPVE